jgi:chorismate mutase / prephenate dehydratase
VSQPEHNLLTLRDQIDHLDQSIIASLAQRMKIVEAIAMAKLESASPLRDQSREDLVLQRLRGHAVSAGLDPMAIEQIYRAVMEMSVAHQESTIRALPNLPLRVGYQGVEGAYSHLAATRRYGARVGGAQLTGHSSFRAAATAVVRGTADVALLPIENSTAGSINETYDLLGEMPLVITGEVINKIDHCLLTIEGATVAELRVVYSHPQALAQCQTFFTINPHIVAEPVSDTAGAAQMVRAAGDKTCAAIASEAAATRWGLVILDRGIQSESGNATRFVEVSRNSTAVSANAVAKTSLVIELTDKPGALGPILVAFAARGISLTKLESRPVPQRPWHYRFYLDALVHAQSDSWAALCSEVSSADVAIKVLGCYAAET